MDVLDFEPALTGEWDAFVGQHPLAGYGHLKANFALAAATPGVRNASLLVREGRAIVAVLPLFEWSTRTLRSIAVRELVSGVFFPGGPLMSSSLKGKGEANALGLLLDAVRQRAQAHGVDRVLISYPNVTAGQPTIARVGYSPLLHHGYHSRPGVGLALDLAQTAEQLAAGRRSGCRQSIAKAQASGATVRAIDDRAEWMSTHALNVQTLGELALQEPQMAAIWDYFVAAGHATPYGVYWDDALAAVTVTIRCGGSAYYWHGWRPQAPKPGASHLGVWAAILAAKEQGCQSFELGSLEFENARNIGISQFKQSFGGTPFQTVAAELDMKPLKSAAISFAQAAISSVRQRRRGPAAASARP